METSDGANHRPTTPLELKLKTDVSIESQINSHAVFHQFTFVDTKLTILLQEHSPGAKEEIWMLHLLVGGQDTRALSVLSFNIKDWP